MQVNKHGIPVVNFMLSEVPTKRPKKQRKKINQTPKLKLTRSVLDKQAIIKERQLNRYVELTKSVNGLEESTHVAVGSDAYFQALQDQFQVVCEWGVSTCQDVYVSHH